MNTIKINTKAVQPSNASLFAWQMIGVYFSLHGSPDCLEEIVNQMNKINKELDMVEGV